MRADGGINMTRALILKPANLLAMLLALGAIGW